MEKNMYTITSKSDVCIGYILESILDEFDFKSIKMIKRGTKEGFDEEIQVTLADWDDVEKFEKTCEEYLTGEFGTYRKEYV